MNRWGWAELPDRGNEIGLRAAPFEWAMSRPSMPIAARIIALTLFVCAATTVAAADNCQRALTFAEPAIMASINSAAFGDFNDDGLPDIAAIVATGDRIIALNRGGGVFQPMPVEVVAGLSGVPIAAATDVNHDGHLDLIYRTSNLIMAALGWGDGKFKPIVTSALLHFPSQTRAIDLNHDGLLDFIDFDDDKRGYTFVQSKGDGTFEEVAHFNLVDDRLQDITKTAGDFDGDGNIDVVRLGTELPSFDSFASFGWSDGALHFVQTATPVDVPNTLQAVDVDGDGADELAAIQDGSLVILRMKSRKAIVERIPVGPRGTTQTLKNPMMLDIDGDGVRDLLFNSGNSLGVLWGTGGGHFHDATYFELAGGGPFAAFDLDGDGIPDFVSRGGRLGLPVLYGATLRAGKPNANRVYPVGFGPDAVALADVDGDGVRDLVITGNPANVPARAMVLFGDGKGGFPRAAAPLVMPALYGASGGFVGDFDGDGHADLAIVPGNAAVKPVISFGTVDGFSAALLPIDADTLLGTFSRGSSSPGVVALKGDDVQLITISSGRTVTASTIYHRPTGAKVLAVRSEGNGPVGIALVTSAGIRLITQTQSGWHESVLTDYAFLSETSAITAVDLDGDGFTDYITLGNSDWMFFARGDGSYRSQPLPTFASIYSVIPADFDGDGVPDLVITARGNYGDPGGVQVLRNAGGTFPPFATAITGAPFGNGAVVNDVDGDGRPDVVIPSFDGAEILNNRCIEARIRVAAVPANPSEGSRVTLVIYPTATNSYATGAVTVSEGGKVLDIPTQRFAARDLGTETWISAPLTAGTHTFHIRYDDQFSASSSIDFVVTTKPQVPRHRAAR
jgi:hypothetical protein